ncbi:MAG: hypothetical protein AAFQ07_04895 [Chloroflexota bacterium]
MLQNENMKRSLYAMVALLVIAPIAGFAFGFDFSVIVMMEIAVIAFFTVVFVMIIGSEEDHYPTAAEDSASVNAWADREAQKQVSMGDQTSVQDLG